MKVTRLRPGEEEQNFWTRVWTGNGLVHVTRSIMYLLIYIGGAMALILPILGGNEIISMLMRKRRRGMIEQMRVSRLVDDLDPVGVIEEMYVSGGIKDLRLATALLQDREELGRRIKITRILSKERRMLASRTEPTVVIVEDGVEIPYTPKLGKRTDEIVDMLTMAGVVMMIENKVIVDKVFEKTLKKVTNYLEEQR